MSTPDATYRVQVRPGFDLDAAAALVDYLDELGISHLYSSPLLQAVPGSAHGYDVVDPTRIDRARGGREGLDRLADALDAAGMGLVLDIVPNHLAVLSGHNPWWWDVLRHGPDSEHAAVFDIDWRGEDVPHLVLPILGTTRAAAVAEGALRLVAEDGEASVAHHDRRLPLRPGSLGEVDLPADAAEAVAATRRDPDGLLALLATQHYRLRHWREAEAELGHRRFFDITSLAGVRVEDEEVFEATHRLVLDLVAAGTVDGLRIDHPDGLRDPVGYLSRLREAAPGAWIVLEKILEPGERRRGDWPVDGTVGYSFARLALGVLVDGRGLEPLAAVYERMVGERPSPRTRRREAKDTAVRDLLVPEWRRLADALTDLADSAGIEISREAAAEVVRELLVAHPVYRTYLRPATGELHDHDRAVIEATLATVRARTDGHGDVVDLLVDVLLRRADLPGAEDFVARLQQTTGPVMAKGVEDTLLYRDVAFAAANDVGFDHVTPAVEVAALHADNEERARRWPRTMLTLSTHDTKRSADVRARLAVLSEIPDRWVRTVRRWRRDCAPLRRGDGPGPEMEYLLWQTALGAWPITADRLTAYARKAAREAKRETSWRSPDDDHEEALASYASGLLEHEPFLAPLRELLETVVPAGRINALTQTLLAVTSPGVPDVYQGDEVWNLSLVDPDNRRPVDVERRRRLLGIAAADPPIGAVLARMEEGLPKLWVLHRALRLRREHPRLLGPGAGYQPLRPCGPREEHAIALLRGGRVAAVAPRLTLGLGPRFGAWRWAGTTLELPAGRWRDVLTGRSHPGGERPLAELLGAFPVALLLRRESG